MTQETGFSGKGYEITGEYRALRFPVTRTEFDAEFGSPATGGTRKLARFYIDSRTGGHSERRVSVRWAEYEDADGALKARWVSVDEKSNIGFGFIV